MRSVVIGTAGHIDHGKSALVKALTGTDPDRLKEEQDRGITIDLGFAHFTVGDTQVALVDVPGHERFVRNMLAGAGGIDAVLLVIDAGESVKAQTREHFEICRLLGITRGAIAITKIDAVSMEMRQRARAEAAALVAGSFLDAAPILDVSARTGEGLDGLRVVLQQLAGTSGRQNRREIARLPIDRAFTIKGFGAVVTGTLVSGALAEGDTVLVLPEGATARVRGVQVHGRPATSVEATQRVAVNVAGLEARDLRRGQTIASDGSLTVTTRADVRLELLSGASALRHGMRVRVHAGAAEFTARLSIAATRSREAAAWTAVKPGDSGVEVSPGGAAFARLKLEAPAALTRGDRMVLRASSPLMTIAGAVVLDPEPPANGVRRDASLPRFLRLDGPEPPMGLFLEERAELGLTARDLVRRLGLDLDRSAEVIAAMVADGTVIRIGDRVIAANLVNAAEQRVEAMLAAFHRASPLEPGLSPGAIRDRLGSRVPEALASAVLARLMVRGIIRGTDRMALSSHSVAASPELTLVRGRVEQAILKGALAPPDAGELVGLVSASPEDVDRALMLLLREKRLVRAGGLLFHSDALGALKGAVQSERAGKPASARVTLDVATFKSRFNLTRKHAIPLLEWLDRERVTRRSGDVRIVL